MSNYIQETNTDVITYLCPNLKQCMSIEYSLVSWEIFWSQNDAQFYIHDILFIHWMLLPVHIYVLIMIKSVIVYYND